MIAYYNSKTKRFISHNPYTQWHVQGEPGDDMKKAALEYYRGLRDTARQTRNTELLNANLIIRVERTEDVELRTIDYTVTAYMQIGETEFSWLKGEKECPEETT